ncbi:zinc finger CCCH domain-containing protein 13-like [Ruditapes philippinarum]|uniref:zinc finger CCCH domain-containing protein 13-like n=1 Tax=Ruditapes philippinarum TaxID=129788 RepID=UPI00295BD85B|nr:zinc finger CCCH domain-containing protein 13-like [Ruditapes philippinarum]
MGTPSDVTEGLSKKNCREKYFQREPLRAEEEKGFGAERGNEYDPERWHYSGCDPNDDKPPDSSRMSRSHDDKWDNKKSQNENVPYVDEYDAYNKDSKNRTARRDERDYSRRWQESLERYGSGSVEAHDGYSQSPKVFDYGHTTRSSDRDIDTYQTSRHGDENERRTDDRFEKFSRDARERETDRRRDVGYRERESERTGYYGDRVQPNYKEGERDKFYDNYYHRERDERFDSRSEEYDHYGDDMANMEEFPEMVEHGDNKSQDGGMLYEDFLFGAEDDIEDIADYRRSGDGTGYRSREVDSENSRKRDDRSRSSEKKNYESRSRDKRYDSYRSRGSDNKGKEALQGNHEIQSRERSKQGNRDIQRRDRYDDINDAPGIRKAERKLYL